MTSPSPRKPSPSSLLWDALPGLRKTKVDCPCSCDWCGCKVNGYRGSVTYVVLGLNDDCKWTRGQIADWLETLDLDLSFGDKP